MEGSCDIVLPPPEESLYTLPRRKTHNIEYGTHAGNASTQPNQHRDNEVKGTEEPNNRSERFEPEVSLPTVSLQTTNNALSTSVTTSNSNCNKTTNGTHSESSV